MFFSFGKKRRSARKSSKKGGKPPSKLLKICRKLKVKTTVKRGSSRVYKKKSVLKKLCLRKLKVMKKKKMMLKKKLLAKKKALKRRKGSRRVKRVSSRMGASEFGARRTRFGACGSAYAPAPGAMMGFGRNITFGGQNFGGMEFGKRRRVGRKGPKSVKMSKAAAMRAFKQFYRRHCSVRRSRFGSGGNPPLSASMGYEFCPSGMGGVLGAMGTGLFASPCKPMNAGEAAAEANLTLPSYQTSAGTTAFGKRRRRRVSRKTAKVPKTKSGLKKALAKCRRMLKKRKVSRRRY